MLQIKELIFKILADVNDNIYNLIDIAIAYIKQHMNWEVEFYDKITARIEMPEVPVYTVREMGVNAFAHAYEKHRFDTNCIKSFSVCRAWH